MSGQNAEENEKPADQDAEITAEWTAAELWLMQVLSAWAASGALAWDVARALLKPDVLQRLQTQATVSQLPPPRSFVSALEKT
jgi:hypothetical protein